MPQTIKIIIVDDHQIIRDGLTNMLQDPEDIRICGSASDYQQAIDLCRQVNPDIVITDLSMPGRSGIELITKISEAFPEIRVLVLSMYLSEDYIFNALKAGASGYLPKQDTTKAELITAIHKIFNGEQYFSHGVAQIISRLYSQSTRKAPIPDDVLKSHTLTPREREILRLFAEGSSNQEISEKLNISVRTVETHKNNIMLKFNFKSTVDMVKFAIRNNLAEL